MFVTILRDEGLFWEGFDWQISQLLKLDNLAWVAAKYALIYQDTYVFKSYIAKVRSIYGN